MNASSPDSNTVVSVTENVFIDMFIVIGGHKQATPIELYFLILNIFGFCSLTFAVMDKCYLSIDILYKRLKVIRKILMFFCYCRAYV